MDVIIIRHGEAEPAEACGDADRKLNDNGRRQSRLAAQAVLNLGARIERILSSPLVRAVQTAEVAAEVHGGSRVEQENALSPDFDAETLMKRLATMEDEGAGCVALVGHSPTLNEFLGLLIAETPRVAISLSKASGAMLSICKSREGMEVELRWIMEREQLKIIAESKR